MMKADSRLEVSEYKWGDIRKVRMYRERIENVILFSSIFWNGTNKM